MKYDTRTHFRDHADDDVHGFTIVDVDEDNEAYRIAEKRGDKWAKAYWMSRAELVGRVESEWAEPIGSISSDQYLKICQRVGATQ